MGTLLVGTMIWQSIDTAPKDGTEILASDYDAIEIVSWEGFSGAKGWRDRLGKVMSPAWWQPLPDHPPLPGDEPELPNGSELPDGYIDPGHSAADRELLEAFYLAARSEGGTTDEITLRGIRAATRAAELLQQRHPEPVPVSERLPGAEDCDEDGRCWLFSKVEKKWSLIDASNPEAPHLQYCCSHWLPATALPPPAGEGEE